MEEWPATADEQVERARKSISTSVEALVYLQDFETRHSATDTQAEDFFASHNRLNAEIELINLYNRDAKIEYSNRNFVFFDFPSEFPLKIERLIFPNWYTACFMSECRNSAIWGTYGDSHTAVCLKFRTQAKDNNAVLDLKREYGYGSGGPIVGYVPHLFHQIVYENKHEPVDFFRSIGRFPRTVLHERWHSDALGNISICAKDIFESEDAWRERYWKIFYDGIVRKLDHWRHESEYRLLLSGDLINFSDFRSRTTNYKFGDLEGIIFGINTPIQAKIEIFKTIEGKCRKEGRQTFRFYQARYNSSAGTIEHDEMPLLKFKND